jgi:hypothetical protein
MKATTAVLGVSFSLMSASVALAADMFTPPLFIGGADAVICRVLNTATTQVNNVTIEIKDAAGVVQATTGPISIAGRTTDGVTDPVPPPAIAYCHVRGVNPGKTRVTLCALESAGPTALACTTTP